MRTQFTEATACRAHNAKSRCSSKNTRSAISKNPSSTKSLRANDVVELSIEKLVYGGEGLARSEGVVIFTPFVAPGDRVRVKIVEVKKNFARAELLEVLSSGPDRIPAPCPIFGSCGGCQWQHLSLETQRKTKTLLVQEAFSRARLWSGEINPCIGSASGWNYRRRVQFKIQKDRIGFFERRSHRLAEVQNCAIAHPKINDELKNLRQSLPLHSSVEIEVFSDERVGKSFDHVQGMEFGFSQINAQVNTQMIDWALSRIQNWNITHLLDLYAGRGNFTIPIAKQFPRVQITGVELNKQSVAHATQISAALPNVSWVCSDVLGFLTQQRRTKSEGTSVNESSQLGIILDPPRLGVDEREIPQLAALNPKQILWIGCDLQNLVRDIQRFLKVAPHFSILEIQPLDMFPQTFHIETAVLLTR